MVNLISINKNMMIFIPMCRSLLMLEPATDDGGTKFYCNVCPYVYRIPEPIEENVLMVKNPTTSAKEFYPG
jgi:DNA-directed RNA polymerase subunit M/transcription elongation factor TFIIS